MNKKEIAERMLISGCSRAQVEFVTGLEVRFLESNHSKSEKVGLRVPGHCFVYTTFFIPQNKINSTDK